MTTAATQNAFEVMAKVGGGDAGALAQGLRSGVTGLGLRALAAKTVHVATSAPERMADVYDNAAAGWLARPIFPPRTRSHDPLPISRAFWSGFWDLVNLPTAKRNEVLPERTLALFGELDPRISSRMAAAALEYPGVAEAAAGGIPAPFDLDALEGSSPASLGYALRQEFLRGDGVVQPFRRGLIPLLRHMPAPLNYINIQVIQSLPVLGVVGGYSATGLDRLAIGGFLMGQVAHHYSALSTAISLTIISLERPAMLELMLDSIFKGWLHGRETPPLIATPWEELWPLRVDQVREALAVTPFTSVTSTALRQLTSERIDEAHDD